MSSTKCPFFYLWAGSSESNQNDDAEVATTSNTNNNATSSSSCPIMKYKEGGFQSLPSGSQTTKCPLGFGGGSQQGPRMGMLHCIVCKSIMYQASTTNCGHTYCKECAEKFKDCPTCGADITSIERNAEVDDVIEEFLKSHAGSIGFWELEDIGASMIEAAKRKEQEQSEFEAMSEKAQFYVQAGMRAMSGRSLRNAMHKFGEAKRIFEEYVQDCCIDEERRACASSLGAVYGALGDCCKLQGLPQESLVWYQKSIDSLQSVIGNVQDGGAVQSSDPMHALSITLNKIGETYHRQGDVATALEFYKKSLDVRQKRYEAYQMSATPQHGEILVSMMIDVAISQAKVADAMALCGSTHDAEEMNDTTRDLLTVIEEKLPQCHSSTSHEKFKALRAHYDMTSTHES